MDKKEGGRGGGDIYKGEKSWQGPGSGEAGWVDRKEGIGSWR